MFDKGAAGDRRPRPDRKRVWGRGIQTNGGTVSGTVEECASCGVVLVPQNPAIQWELRPALLVRRGNTLARCYAARATMQKDFWLAGRVANLLEIDLVKGRNPESARVVRLDRKSTAT